MRVPCPLAGQHAFKVAAIGFLSSNTKCRNRNPDLPITASPRTLRDMHTCCHRVSTGYRPTAAATTTPPTPVNPHAQALSIPLEAVFEGVLLAAPLLADDAWDGDVARVLDAEPDIDVVAADDDAEEGDEVEVEEADTDPDVEDEKPTVALDKVTEA